MANIKDVALAAGVSPTTVSLIINGKAKERRIADETVDRVYKVMNELNYHPNMSARHLRSDSPARSTIAFYWPNDSRAGILSSFVTHFHSVLQELNFDGDIVIRSYKNCELEKYADPIKKNSYNGVIIGGSAKEDLEYLETLETRTPVVLINRTLEKYSSVGNDNVETGLLAARLIKQKGYEKAAVFTSNHPFLGTGLRTQGFLFACSELNINVESCDIFYQDNTIEGGALAAENYCDKSHRPKVIFCDSDSMALGALHTFYKRGIRLPEDAEIIAIQFMDDAYTKYSVPALTTITMPNRETILEAVKILIARIQNPLLEPSHIIIPSTINVRDTFC